MSWLRRILTRRHPTPPKRDWGGHVRMISLAEHQGKQRHPSRARSYPRPLPDPPTKGAA